MTTQPQQPHPDPVIEATISRALAPYLAIASPAVLATMREQLALMLTTDELAVAMMEQLRDDPHAVPDVSGEGRIDGAEVPAERKRGTGGA